MTKDKFKELKKKDINKEVVEKLIEKTNKSEAMRLTHDKGFTVSEVAEMADVRYQFAYNVLSEHAGEELNVQNDGPTKKELILELWLGKKEMSRADIAKEAGASSGYVFNVTREVVPGWEKARKEAVEPKKKAE